jgi:hypothetical protein
MRAGNCKSDKLHDSRPDARSCTAAKSLLSLDLPAEASPTHPNLYRIESSLCKDDEAERKMMEAMLTPGAVLLLTTFPSSTMRGNAQNRRRDVILNAMPRKAFVFLRIVVFRTAQRVQAEASAYMQHPTR